MRASWITSVSVLLCAALGACKSDDKVTRELGAACRSASDCDMVCLPAPTWPNGFCSRDCGQDADCPAGAACIAANDGMVCLYSCTDDRECDFLNGSSVSVWKCLERSAGDLTKLVCAPGTSSGVPVDGGLTHD